MRKLLFFFTFLLLISFASALTHITNCEELQNMSNNLSENYVLDNNIDCSATSGWNPYDVYGWHHGFIPIGNSTDQFTGNFDGQNYNITNLYIFCQSNSGLFGTISSSSQIENVGLVGSIINCWSLVSSGEGCLASYNNGSINNSYAIGYVYGGNSLGGLVSSNEGNISNSYSIINLASAGYCGGLVGGNSGNIDNSYAIGSISYAGSNGGGLVGGNSGNISNSYAKVNIAGNQPLGGLVADNSGSIINSYATGNVGANNGGSIVWKGGLIGHNTGSCANSYWDLNTSNNNDGGCGTGKTTIEMQLIPTFNSWGFNTTWGINESYDYPCLLYQQGCSLNPLPSPVFSNYSDNEGIFKDTGIAEFNITILNTNGSVWLNFDDSDYQASYLGNNTYNFSAEILGEGSNHSYYWIAQKNSTIYNDLTSSLITSYVVLPMYSPEGRSIFYLLKTGGAGLGSFMLNVAQGLPILAFLLALIVIIIGLIYVVSKIFPRR